MHIGPIPHVQYVSSPLVSRRFPNVEPTVKKLKYLSSPGKYIGICGSSDDLNMYNISFKSIINHVINIRRWKKKTPIEYNYGFLCGMMDSYCCLFILTQSLHVGDDRSAVVTYVSSCCHLYNLRNGAMSPARLQHLPLTCYYCTFWLSLCSFPAGTRRWINVGLTLVQRRRWWTNVKPTLIQRLVFVGNCVGRWPPYSM